MSLVGALLLALLAGLLVGAVAIAPGDVLSALSGASGSDSTIVRDLRLPRVIGAALVGGALAVAGVLLQSLLRNPLADPYVTGSSAGASLAAVLVIATGAVSPLALPLAAFAGALAASLLVWQLARAGGRTTVLSVLLAGVVLSSFCGALVTFLLVWSDRLALRLRAVLGWLLGGISVLDLGELVVAGSVIAIGVALALMLAPRVDAFAFGEDSAAALGVDPERATVAILLTCSLLTGAAVALSGLIGFVGLLVPHAARFAAGASAARLIPLCFLAGATVLVLADLGARTVVAPSELPVGVITGLIGGPFFLSLLMRSRGIARA
ncbi:MAG: iron ABC transporter permease [Chloroflexi bacterium]|nr:iron ABC transporter permease [Chloroflexota bacterium]